MKYRGLALATIVLGAAGLVFGAWIPHYQMLANEIRLPAPAPIPVWIPEGAEIYPAHVVTPGTFSVSLGLGEFQQRFPTGGLVAFHYNDRKEDANLRADTSYVTVWNTKPGSSIFYHVVQDVRPPGEWPEVVRIARLELVEGKIFAFPHEHTALHDQLWVLYIGATFCGGTALVLYLVCLLTLRLEKAAKIFPNRTSTSNV